jgi:hypothetical protein
LFIRKNKDKSARKIFLKPLNIFSLLTIGKKKNKSIKEIFLKVLKFFLLLPIKKNKDILQGGERFECLFFLSRFFNLRGTFV